MNEFHVKTPALRSLGHHFETYPADTITFTANMTRNEAGFTGDMDGLLSIIAPAIKKTADLFADHYDALGTVVQGTGTALVKTADDYDKVDAAVAAAMDQKAVVAGGGNDAALGTGGAWTSTGPTGMCYAVDPDPAAEIRGDMDFDVQAIDWVFNKFTGHHITEPIDSIVGNWTTLTARGKTWNDVSTNLKNHGGDILHNTAVVDGSWDGVAATSFNAYGHKLGEGFKGEAEIPLAITWALDNLAEKWESLYKECVDLLESVIHDVEIGAAALAAGWWCGVGEAVAAKKCQEALVAFYRAYKIVKMVKHVITFANQVVKGFHVLVDFLDLATHIPEKIDGEIQHLKDLMSELGSIPEHLANLSHLPGMPSGPYGGPGDPNV